MKKFILLIALSVLLYAAPGNAGVGEGEEGEEEAARPPERGTPKGPEAALKRKVDACLGILLLIEASEEIGKKERVTRLEARVEKKAKKSKSRKKAKKARKATDPDE